MKRCLILALMLWGPGGYAIVADRMVVGAAKDGFGGFAYSDFSYSGGNVELLTWGAGGRVGYTGLFEDSKDVKLV